MDACVLLANGIVVWYYIHAVLPVPIKKDLKSLYSRAG
jgi:hypothetical protein